jgi:hypothetical protein
MRLRALTVAVPVAVSIAIGVTTPGAASPYPEIFCDGTVQARGQQWGFDGKAISCDFMRRWTRQWLRHGWEPRGWECYGVMETGDCHRRHSHHPRRWFEFYVID